mmetsp:Transcript_6898/g.20047  ORF Transcript_6898/g.20047 Transcript_6898/m.20047 type:complete len:201 (+) Transcript_6898:344-946(+)
MEYARDGKKAKDARPICRNRDGEASQARIAGEAVLAQEHLEVEVEPGRGGEEESARGAANPPSASPRGVELDKAEEMQLHPKGHEGSKEDQEGNGQEGDDVGESRGAEVGRRARSPHAVGGEALIASFVGSRADGPEAPLSKALRVHPPHAALALTGLDEAVAEVAGRVKADAARGLVGVLVSSALRGGGISLSFGKYGK